MSADSDHVGLGGIQSETAIRIGSEFLVAARDDRVGDCRSSRGVDDATVDADRSVIDSPAAAST
jgi:hypothetical protein